MMYKPKNSQYRRATIGLHSASHTPRGASLFLRITALLLTFAYLSQSTGWAETGTLNLSPAAPISPPLIREPAPALNHPIPFLSDITHISSRYEGKNPGLIIQIEDAHLFLDAQKQIAETLTRLNDQWNIRTVGMEGASGEILHRVLSFYPHETSRKVLAQHYLKEGMISGPEFAALAKNPSLILTGLEDPRVYALNRDIFLDGIQSSPHALEEIGKIKDTFEVFASRLFSKEMQRFRRERSRRLSERSDFITHTQYLLKEAERLSVQGEFSQARSAARLAALSIRKNPKSAAEIENIQKSLSLDLFKEIDRLESAVKDRLFENESQRQLDYWLSLLEVSARLVQYELTEAEAIFFESHKNDFRSKAMRKALQSLISRFATNLKTKPIRWHDIDSGIQKAASFYQYALERDQILAEKAMRLMENSPGQKIAIVTGGFHSAGIQNILRKKGISFITLRPKIQSLETDEVIRKRYLAEMRRENRFFDALFQLQTPRPFPTTQSQSPAHLAFLKSSAEILNGLSTAAGSIQPDADQILNLMPGLSSDETKWAKRFYGRSHAVLHGNVKSGVITFTGSTGQGASAFYWGEQAFQLGLPRHAPIQIEDAEGRLYFYQPHVRIPAISAPQQRSELRVPPRAYLFPPKLKAALLGILLMNSAAVWAEASSNSAVDTAESVFKKAAGFSIFSKRTNAPVTTSSAPLQSAASTPERVAEVRSSTPQTEELAASYSGPTVPVLDDAANSKNYFFARWNSFLLSAKEKSSSVWNHLSPLKQTPVTAWATHPFLILPTWVLSFLGLTGLVFSSKKVRGATAQSKIDASKARIRMLDEPKDRTSPREKQRLVKEHLDQAHRLEILNETARLPKSSWMQVTLTLVFEFILAGAALYLFFALGLDLASVIKIYVFFRLGAMAGAIQNEWGHIVAGILAGQGWNALNLKNLLGNRFFGWFFKLLPLSWLAAPPYVFIKDTPSDKQADFIRRGGFWISIFMLGAFITAWNFLPAVASSGLFQIVSLEWLELGGFSEFLILGMIGAAFLSFSSDWLSKKNHPRYFLCGNFAFFLPSQSGFWRAAKEIFQIVRILSLRGTDGIGMVSWYDLRSKGVMTVSLSVMMTIAFAGTIALTAFFLSWTLAWWFIWLVSAVPAALIGWWLTRNLEPGSISDRIRKVGTKRVDIALMLLTSLLVRTFVIYMFAGRKSAWTLVTGHVRRATSSPNPKATQPQTWVHTNLWNLLFKRTHLLYLTPDGFELKNQWAEPTVGHNGDVNGIYFKVFGKMIPHNPDKHSPGDLHNYMQVSLDQKNNDEGDTVNGAAGMMKKLVTQGNFRAALLLAYEQVILDGKTPEDWAFASRDLRRLTREFQKKFMEHRDRYYQSLNGSRRSIALESIPDSVLDQITADLLKTFARHPFFGAVVPRNKQAAFVKYAVYSLFRNNVFEALKHYATKLDPYDRSKPWVGGADGTHGLVVTSPAYNGVGLYRKGQPLTVGFTEDFSSFSVFSSAPLINDGRLRYSLDLLDDEICYLYWDEHGTVQFVIYNVIEERNISRVELQQNKRIVDLENNPDAPHRPDPYEMFPIEEHLRQLADFGERAAESVGNPNDLNHESVNVLVNHLERLHQYQAAHEGHLPPGTHILLVGNMPHEAGMELFKNTVNELFPEVVVDIRDSDEAMRFIVNHLDHPEEIRKKLKLTEHTLVVPLSHSGEAFDTANVFDWLATQIHHAMPILGDRHNQIAHRAGPGSVLSTEIGSLRMTEHNTHTTSTMDILILAAVVEAARRLKNKHPDTPVLGGILDRSHLEKLNRALTNLTQRLPSITGYDSERKKVDDSKPRKQLIKLARRIAKYSHETFFSAVIMSFTVGLLVALAVSFFPSQILGPFNVLSLQFIGVLILNTLFAYFLTKITARILRSFGFYRKLTKRAQSPTIHFLEESTAVARRVELLGDQTVSLGYQNVPKIKAEATSKSNRRFSPSRGDVVISIERQTHASDKGADSMTGKQTLGPRTDGFLNEATEYYAIGHGAPANDTIYDGKDGYVDLFAKDDQGKVVHPYSDFHEVTGPALTTMRDFMAHLLQIERDTARFVFLNEHATSLAFPGTRLLIKEGLLRVPYIKWAVYLFINRFPWLTRFYPFWHAHGGVLYPTTASTRDVSPIQTWLTTLVKEKDGAAWTLQKVGKPASLVKEIPAPEIPAEVYSENYPIVHASHVTPMSVIHTPAAHEPQSKPKKPSPQPRTTSSASHGIRQNGAGRHNAQLEMQHRYTIALIESLDEELSAGKNGNVPGLIREARENLNYMNETRFDPHVVRTYREAVLERLEIGDDELERSELRSAAAAKDQLSQTLLLDAERARFKALLSEMRAAGLNPEKASEYFTAEHQKQMNILEQNPNPSSGAYILTDYYDLDLIQSVLNELPPQVPLILYLETSKTTREQRRLIHSTFHSAILQGRLMLPRSDTHFQLLVSREMRARGMDASKVLEFSTGKIAVTQEEKRVLQALMTGAVHLTDHSLVIINQKRRLDSSQARHFEIHEVYETLIASAQAVSTSA